MPILKASLEYSELHRTSRTLSESDLEPPLSSFERLGISYRETMSEGPPDVIANLSAEEASRIIHSHRKVRYGKLDRLEPFIGKIFLFRKSGIINSFANKNTIEGTACWPCRQRKVKCDNKQPCENCVKRDHASLCSYNPKQNASKASAASSVAGVKRARSPGSENSLRKEEDRWPRTTGKQ